MLAQTKYFTHFTFLPEQAKVINGKKINSETKQSLECR